VALVAAAGPAISAHRLDEYLQAARIALDPGRAIIDLDLTPGAAVADAVLAGIDRDRNGTISAGEGAGYAAAVRDAITLESDGQPLTVELIDTTIPDLAAMREGEGSIRLRLAATLPALAAGTHHLRYRNTHRPDISVYLANVLVPASDRVTVSAQRRDVDQRELTVDYVLDGDRTPRARAWYAVAIGCVLLALTSLWWRSRA
jgi:hypothetical protein